MIVPAERTILQPTEAIDAIWHAHQDVVGGECAVALLEILSAQSALETGRWHAMWNWNFGNIRGVGDAGSMALKGADEIVNGERQIGPEVEAGFAAYLTKASGARAFVRFLGASSHPPNPNRYQKAWDAACAGDVQTYVEELRANGYFTASLAKYRAGVEGVLEWLRSGPMPEFLRYLSPAAKETP